MMNTSKYELTYAQLQTRSNERRRRQIVAALSGLTLVVLWFWLALSSAHADTHGRSVATVVRDTNSNPMGAVKTSTSKRTKRTNPAMQRYTVNTVRTDRWYGCSRNRHGLWICTIRLETLMSGKHPSCKCVTQRSYRRVVTNCRCW